MRILNKITAQEFCKSINLTEEFLRAANKASKANKIHLLDLFIEKNKLSASVVFKIVNNKSINHSDIDFIKIINECVILNNKVYTLSNSFKEEDILKEWENKTVNNIDIEFLDEVKSVAYYAEYIDTLYTKIDKYKENKKIRINQERDIQTINDLNKIKAKQRLTSFKR